MSLLSNIKLQIPDDFGFSRFCGSDTSNSSELVIDKCGFDNTFMQSSLEPFTVITGGLLPVIFWTVISLAVYIKYKNAMLAMLVGIPIMLTATFAIPQHAEMYVTIITAGEIATTIFILIWKIPRD